MARRLAQSANSSAKWVLIVAYPLAIGLVVLGAFKLGWIAIAELPSVSLTAFVAFNAGILVYYFYLRHFYLKLYRADGRGGTWSYCFDDAGIVYAKEGRLEVRLTWRAVDSVEDTGSMVLFRFSVQGLSIPAHFCQRCRTYRFRYRHCRAHQGRSRKCRALTNGGSGLPRPIFSPLPGSDIPSFRPGIAGLRP